MDRRFLAVLGVIAAVFVGIIVFNGGDKADAPEASNTSAQATSHVRGKLDSKVTLTDYSDFQCSACARYYPILKQVEEAYADKIKFQFRHFPLTQIHPNAFAGSRAAEAAGLQGKFFEMYDLLYQNNDPTGATGWVASQNPMQYFEDYAKQLSLDVQKFKDDFKSSKVNDAINADVREGNKLDITGTPTFAINGKKIDTPPSTFEAFQKLLDEELAKAATQ